MKFSAAFSLALAAGALAQTHRVTKADAVTRAVAVYEYSGDLQHPSSARLIPVSLFLGGHFEDAGIYLARPVPLALDSGNVYEFQHSGVRAGFLDLAYTRNYSANAGGAAISEDRFDDGWFGYGRFRPLPTPKAPKALTARNNNAHVVTESTDGRPQLVSKTDDPPKPGAGQSPRGADDDPDRPAKISLPDDTSGKKADTPDPERPTLHRQPGPPPSASGTDAPVDPKTGKPAKPPKVVVTATGDPSTDPDRPSIRRHTVEENSIPPDPVDLAGGKGNSGPADTVTGSPGIENGGRPGMRRGRQSGPVGETLAHVSPLSGMHDLNQTVAVSDAKDRPEHDFTYHFPNDADRDAILKRMEALAQEVLARPVLATDAPDILKKEAGLGPTATSSTSAGASRKPHASPQAGRSARAKAAPASSNNALADEQLTAYQLSFSAEPTFVFTAHTPAGIVPVHYATVVAQPDLENKLKIAMRTTTDADHLDRVPRFRLIDAVDADGSNRASLLFELRAAHSRQFALYRLLGPHPDQLFLTGSTM